MIGVTGACGKTTTKNILVELLGSRMTTVGSPNSFNNDIGVPLTLFLADDATEALVSRGIIPRPCCELDPQAFPQAFVPDPPAYRRWR